MDSNLKEINMPAQIYSYTPIIESGPNGRSLLAKLPEGAIELCVLDGLTYVSVPDGATLPEQHPEIVLSAVTVDYGLREKLKKASRAVMLIDQGIVDTIRSKYSIDDEQYFARIGVGAALGVYTFQPGEQDALLAFGAHVEGVRQWGRLEREKIGL